MKKMRKLTALAMIAAMILGCMSCLVISTSAAPAPEIIKDGLYAWYDGINNSNGTQDMDANVWKDLSGNGRHMRVRVDEKNYWQDNAYHSDGALNYFHEDMISLINSETFTVEMVMGEYAPSPTMGDRMVLFYSDNTELCLCFREDKQPDPYFEFKYNDANGDRPKSKGDVNQVQNATVAITFDFEAKICYVYIDGTLVAQGVPEHMLNTDLFYFNSSDPTRCFAGDVHGFRFYDRVLSPEELGANAAADALRYRSGNKYDIVKEYDDSGEVDEGGEQIAYENNLVPINGKTNVIDLPGTGAYGSEMLSDYMYPFESDATQWEGAKLTYMDDGSGKTPNFHINYRKFCGQNGMDQIDSANAGWVVLKIKVDGSIDDINAYGMCGTTYSTNDAGGFSTGSIYGGAECTGEVEYLIYDFAEVFEGGMNYLKMTFEGMTAETVIYLQEVAFFATEEEAFTYAGEEYVDETEAPVTDAPIETEAPGGDDTQAPDETQAPAGDGKTDDTKAPAGDDKTDDTKAPAGDDKTGDTEAPDEGGCASVVGFGAAAVLVAVAAAVVLKKKE